MYTCVYIYIYVERERESILFAAERLAKVAPSRRQGLASGKSRE